MLGKKIHQLSFSRTEDTRRCDSLMSRAMAHTRHTGPPLWFGQHTEGGLVIYQPKQDIFESEGAAADYTRKTGVKWIFWTKQGAVGPTVTQDPVTTAVGGASGLVLGAPLLPFQVHVFRRGRGCAHPCVRLCTRRRLCQDLVADSWCQEAPSSSAAGSGFTSTAASRSRH